jgi:hypothetical protein
MEITVPMNYTSLNLFLLDRVNIDYPTIYMPANPTEGIRIYGKAIYGVDRYPLSQWSLSLTLTDIFKIIGISQDVVRETITFNLKKELA